MKSWLLFPVLMLACVAAQADLYRWVDADGSVHYSDRLPPAGVKQVETKKARGGKASEAPLPYDVQLAVKNFPVTLYSSACGNPCAQAHALLAKRGIPYTDSDVTDPATRDELKKLTGGVVEVPVLKGGRDMVRGFEESGWNTSLDAAGYPRSVVLPRPPAKPPKPAAASQ